jgi:5-methylcytosine-specific restriction endonuclease McrA
VIRKRTVSPYITTSEAAEFWREANHIPCIKLSNGRTITPRQLRQDFVGKPCQCCSKRMVDYSDDTITDIQAESEQRQWFVTDYQGKKRYTQMGPNKFCHPRCVTLDHKLPKSKYPQLMFEFENLQIWCAGCNMAKQNSLTYEFDLAKQSIKNRAKAAIDKIQNM